MAMSEEEAELAESLHRALVDYENNTERSLQQAIGVSELGTCREMTRRTLVGVPRTNEHFSMSAFVGAATGERAEEAIITHLWPDALRQVTLHVDLGERWRLPGHADIVRPGWGVIDGKTVNELHDVRRDGASLSNRFQRHLYTLGAHQSGLLSIPLEEAKTANFWIDRSGQEGKLHVEIEPFSWEVVDEANEWLNDVAYAIENNETASKDRPRNWCWVACPWVLDCRGLDSDVTGRIEDPELVRAVESYQEGKELATRGEKMKKSAQRTLQGIRGNTATHSVRWIHVNASTFNVTRREHQRLEIKPLRSDE